MWFNPIMIWLLRSPLHGFMSKNTMLITYTGRKSGKTFTTPVNYLRMKDNQGEFLGTTSLRERTWWRNLRGGAQVTVRVRGKNLKATAQAIEDQEEVARNLAAYVEQWPAVARYLDIRKDSAGFALGEDTLKAAQTRVFIQTRLE
jgi:deazaflavin-dependent oxidoreductase (nitroreductase family)